MIIYNITLKVDNSIATQWLQWMKEEHISEVIGTDCFTHATFLRLLEADDTEGPTYAVQFHAESKAKYNHYIATFATALRQKTTTMWGQKVIGFRSVLQLVD